MMVLRNGRGLVPEPVKTDHPVDHIIALGGNQKNTFAVGRKNHMVIGPHIGDLDSEEMLRHGESQLNHFKEWFDIQSRFIAIDKHPLYAARSLLENQGGRVVPVQHHHAHHVSCMEDNGLTKPCLSIILDGTGYGDDGQTWGFEFLYGNAAAYKRLGHLSYSPLPGGEKAIKEPWRNAAGMLIHLYPLEGRELAIQLFPDHVKEIEIIVQMVKNKLNSPMAGTCGRLFDAVSAILGICTCSTYEGEAAVKLSDPMTRLPSEFTAQTYPYQIKPIEDAFQIDFSEMIRHIAEDKLNQRPVFEIIASFHETVVTCCVEMMQKLTTRNTELNRNVVLSGGSFQNIYLSNSIKQRLEREGFTVFTHKRVPCNDGGLALGQLIIASQAGYSKGG